MVYSFDVFDTCLCRRCGEPRLTFDVLSLKVQEAMGEACNERLRQLFVAVRAETYRSDIVAIYDSIAQHFPLPYASERMAAMEMEVERQMLAPVEATLQLVNHLRDKGTVRFISDMYLPSAFIKERLIAYGFFKEGDKLYVSEELHAWKHDGSLFRLIHEEEGIPYRQWHHYGNCRHSDYKVPRNLGIHAHHLSYGYLPYEMQWRKMPVLQYQYPAILAGVARAARLSAQGPDDQKDFVCDVSAPLMVSWVLRVMNDARANGIRRLYFCARDTHTMFLVARRLQPLFPEVSPHYLFISRNALQQGNQALAFHYFLEKGLASKEKTAIVDSNSSGKTLRVLNQMMKQYGCDPVAGYFLVSDALPKETALSFHSICPRYINTLGNRKERSLTGMMVFFELVLSLNHHKRTECYEVHGSTVRPVFGPDDDDYWEIKGTGARQAKKWNDQLVLDVCDAFVNTGLFRYSGQLFDHVVIPSLTGFFDCPQKLYLSYLRRFVLWDHPLVGPLWGNNKGLWRRASRFYYLPSLISKWVWKNRK